MKKSLVFVLSGALLFGGISCSSYEPPQESEDDKNNNDNDGNDEGKVEEVVTNTLDKKKLEILKGDISLNGTVNEKYGENGDNISSINVAFKEDSYHMRLENVDGVNEGRIFKIGGVPTICGINLQNQQVFASMKDDDGNVSSWDEYDNPFKELSLYDFDNGDKEGVYNLKLDTEEAKSNALNLVGSLTNYNFVDLKEVQITIENGTFKTFKATSKTIESYFGDVVISSELTFDKFGDDVPRLEYPEKYEHQAEHDKLANALKEVSYSPLKVHLEQLSTSEANNREEADTYKFDGYYTDNLVYVYADYGYGDVEGSGACVVGNDIYQIEASPNEDDPTKMDYLRKFYPSKEGEDGTIVNLRSERGDFNIAASEIFDVVSDKEFVCTNEFAGTIAYNYSFNLNPFSASSTYVKVTLDDSYKLKTIEFGDELFDKTIVTFNQIGGTIEFPFDVNTIEIEEDPFLKFVNTFTGVDKGGVTHTFVISSQTEATIDGKSVDKITRKSDTRVELIVGSATYSISYSTYSGSYSLSYDDGEGGFDYYTLTVSNS